MFLPHHVHFVDLDWLLSIMVHGLTEYAVSGAKLQGVSIFSNSAGSSGKKPNGNKRKTYRKVARDQNFQGPEARARDTGTQRGRDPFVGAFFFNDVFI